MNLNEDKQVYMYNKHKAITKQLQPSFACQNCNFFLSTCSPTKGLTRSYNIVTYENLIFLFVC